VASGEGVIDLAPGAVGGSEYEPADVALFEAFQAHQTGQFEEAIASYRRAIELRPGFVEAMNNMGIAYSDLRQFPEAIEAYRGALSVRTDVAEIWNNLGDACHSLGDRAAAMENYRRAVAIKPEYGIAWRNLGDALRESGRHDEAEECFLRAVAMTPQLDPTLSPAEVGIREIQLQYSQTVRDIEKEMARDPFLAAAYEDAGKGYEPPAGITASAAARHRLAADLRKRYSADLSSMLMRLHYDPATPPQFLYDAHGEVERLFANLPRSTVFANARDPERRLRIGYVSADFRTHSVSYFMKPVFAAHDPESFETYVYSGSAVEDARSEYFRARCREWRSIVGVGDDQVARQIREDEIDILVDLSGHTYGERLAVFARRAAPVQVTWLGYPNTTGLTTMDYRITDAVADPVGKSDKLVREALVRLPKGFHCYEAPDEAPPVAPLPANAYGHITFGSFNALFKVNAQVIDLWAAVLRRVPDSRLLLKGKWLEIDDMRKRVLEGFLRRGIAADRIELLARVNATADHLAVYGRVDIALDTFPYNGVTTTCEALWMGVPVVSLIGERHAARVGASILSHAGLDHLIARDPDAYVAIAAGLAEDRDGLARFRSGLRDRLAASPVCDGVGFTRQLESAYRTMWRTYCARS
jgi:predicted O-linked N-acetylglucosamine transferase (SPINDLY family)